MLSIIHQRAWTLAYSSLLWAICAHCLALWLTLTRTSPLPSISVGGWGITFIPGSGRLVTQWLSVTHKPFIFYAPNTGAMFPFVSNIALYNLTELSVSKRGLGVQWWPMRVMKGMPFPPHTPNPTHTMSVPGPAPQPPLTASKTLTG